MIEEQEFAVIEGLAPPLAFVRLVRRFRTALQKKLQDNSFSSASAVQEYINHVVSTASALEINEFKDWQIPVVSDDIWNVYERLTREVDRYIVHVEIANVRQSPQNSVGLELYEKREIRHYVEQIKHLIENSKKLEVPKKERLFDRINDFLQELDRERTPIRVLSDVVIELSRTGGQAAHELEPAWKWVKLIAGVFGGRQENERAGLPKPSQPKKLEPPKRQLPAPKKDRKSSRSYGRRDSVLVLQAGTPQHE